MNPTLIDPNDIATIEDITREFLERGWLPIPRLSLFLIVAYLAPKALQEDERLTESARLLVMENFIRAEKMAVEIQADDKAGEKQGALAFVVCLDSILKAQLNEISEQAIRLALMGEVPRDGQPEQPPLPGMAL